MTAQMAMGHSRQFAVAFAFGLAIGSAVLAILAVVGLQSLIARYVIAAVVLHVIGILYLTYLGYRLIVHNETALHLVSQNEASESNLTFARFSATLRSGFLTQVSNPKTVVYYVSIRIGFFSEVSVVQSPMIFFAVSVVFIVEFFWYALVATMLSTTAASTFYLRRSSSINKLCGLLLILIALSACVSILP